MRLEVSSIRDLPEMHRMGHTCANLNGDLFFVWGGTDENVAFIPSPNTHLWIYETLTGYCRHRSCFGECPPYLSGITSTLIGQKMYVFGGHSTAHDNWLNSLYCLDLETFIWKDLGSHAKAEPTKPIRSDKCVSWSFNGRLYVFGGYGWSQVEHLIQLLDIQQDLQVTPDYRWPKFGWNNQLVEFNPNDNSWRWPKYSGKVPSARAAHSGALMGSRYYLFGGRDSQQRLNDLYTFDMKTFEWNQIATFSSDQPLERPIGHLLESSDDDRERQEERQADDEEEDYQNEMLADQIAEEIQEQEELIPSSSASAQLLENPEPKPSTTNNLHLIDIEDDDDDEAADYGYEYNHPSHLLERLSLSSHQSITGSSNLNDIDCLDQHQSDQNEEDGETNNNIRMQNPSYLYSSSNSSQDIIVNNAQQVPQQQQPANDQINREGDSVAESTADRTVNEVIIPPGRSFSSFTPIDGQNILLYGGVSSQDENLDDCWMFNIKHCRWTRVNLRNKLPRLWHTGSRTRNNEVVIIGGSSSDKVDEFCSEVLTIAFEPKSLKRLALDAVSRSIKMRTVTRTNGLPPTITKLVKLRKQAMLLSMRGFKISSLF